MDMLQLYTDQLTEINHCLDDNESERKELLLKHSKIVNIIIEYRKKIHENKNNEVTRNEITRNENSNDVNI